LLNIQFLIFSLQKTNALQDAVVKYLFKLSFKDQIKKTAESSLLHLHFLSLLHGRRSNVRRRRVTFHAAILSRRFGRRLFALHTLGDARAVFRVWFWIWKRISLNIQIPQEFFFYKGKVISNIYIVSKNLDPPSFKVLSELCNKSEF